MSKSWNGYTPSLTVRVIIKLTGGVFKLAFVSHLDIVESFRSLHLRNVTLDKQQDIFNIAVI